MSVQLDVSACVASCSVFLIIVCGLFFVGGLFSFLSGGCG